MAVYFDYKVGNGTVKNPRWSQDLSAEPCLAVGIDNTLQVFTQEGESIVTGGDDGIITVPKKGSSTPKASKAHVSAIDWHPTQKLLCAGWTDGTVTFMRTGGSSSSTSVMHMGQEAHQQGRDIIFWNLRRLKTCLILEVIFSFLHFLLQSF